MHDSPGEPHDNAHGQANDQANDQANERKGLRALFRDAAVGDSGMPAAEPDAAAGGRPGRPRGSGGQTDPADPGQRPVTSGPRGSAAAGDGRRAGTASAGLHAASSLSRGSSRAASPSTTSPSTASPSAARHQHFAGPLISRPLISPRLRADPRVRVWITRVAVSLALYIGFTIGLNWRYGLTAAVVYAAADALFRSRTAVVVPASVRITSAQRFTRRRLRILRPSGYHALHARTIPGTKHVIDHVVVGPAGVFTLDSQRLDRRLPLRIIDGMLYHGRVSMDGRLDHAAQEADYAARFIAAELGRPVAVHPVMVTYGPDTSWVIMAVKGIDVLDGSRVGTYFRRRSREIRRQAKNDGPQALSSHQVDAIVAAAARALPPLA